MNEQFLDASSIDDLNDYDLTGEIDDLEVIDSNESEEPVKDTTDDNPDSSPEEEPILQKEVDTQDNEPSNTEDDFTKEVLRLKGINDPSKIKFEDESGAIIERNWEDLTTNEKLSILTLEEDADTDLEEEEIDFINMLREANLTPSQYIQYVQNTVKQQILDNQPNVYEVDNLSDDELFALDLIEKLGEDNVTDEELQEALVQAKNNEVLYAKLVEALRTYYKGLEDKRNFEQELAQKALLEQDYNRFSEQILNLIEGFEEIAGQEIELSTDDKNDIANYILTRDDTGLSDFYKDLQNPQALTTAAFWVLKGPEIMQELLEQIQEAYKRGYALGSSSVKTPKPSTPKVVIAPKPTNLEIPVNNDASAAFGDDESYLYN